MENEHLYLNYPLKMVIFHRYVKLPEGHQQKMLLQAMKILIEVEIRRDNLMISWLFLDTQRIETGQSHVAPRLREVHHHCSTWGRPVRQSDRQMGGWSQKCGEFAN